MGCVFALGIWKTTSFSPLHPSKVAVTRAAPTPQATPSPVPVEDSNLDGIFAASLHYVLATRGDEWRDSRRWYAGTGTTARELHRRWPLVYIGPEERFLPVDGYTLIYPNEIITYPDGHTLVLVKVHRIGFNNHVTRRRGYAYWEKVTLRLVKRQSKWRVLGLKGQWGAF